MTITLGELLKDSAYKLTQFKPDQIAALEARITMKETGKLPAPYVTCLVRGKPIKLTPEEAVRQLYVMVLKDDLSYPINRLSLEYDVTRGREKKRVDICVFDKDKANTPYILVVRQWVYGLTVSRFLTTIVKTPITSKTFLQSLQHYKSYLIF